MEASKVRPKADEEEIQMISVSDKIDSCPDCSAEVRRPVFGVRRPNHSVCSDEMLCVGCAVPLKANELTRGWYSAPYIDPEYIDDFFTRAS